MPIKYYVVWNAETMDKHPDIQIDLYWPMVQVADLWIQVSCLQEFVNTILNVWAYIAVANLNMMNCPQAYMSACAIVSVN